MSQTNQGRPSKAHSNNPHPNRTSKVKRRTSTDKDVDGRDSISLLEPNEDMIPQDLSPKSVRKRQQELAAQRELMLKTRNELYLREYLVKKSNFDKDEVRNLQNIYRAFRGTSKWKNNKKNERIDRMRFRSMVYSLFGITNNNMLDRVFQAFDGDSEGTVSEVEWILGLSNLLRGTLDQQIAYSFDVYDFTQDRSLGREEVLSCVRGCLNIVPGVLEGDELEEGTNELTDIVIKKLDITRDSGIDFAEYRHVLRKDPLLLEVLGECLPTEKALVPFMGLLNNNPRANFNFYSRPGDASWAEEKERYAKYNPEVDFQHVGFLTGEEEGRVVGKIGVDVATHPTIKPFASNANAKPIIRGKTNTSRGGFKNNTLPKYPIKNNTKN